MDKAKVFWSGRSQAVRLPKQFRFEGQEVRIRRHGTGVLLEPIATDWDWLDKITGPLDADFIAAVLEPQTPALERPEIDEFFKNR
jgi:antitoxin VapB